jgi:hypothetical protein
MILIMYKKSRTYYIINGNINLFTNKKKVCVSFSFQYVKRVTVLNHEDVVPMDINSNACSDFKFM